jgi:hypothetical protein
MEVSGNLRKMVEASRGAWDGARVRKPTFYPPPGTYNATMKAVDITERMTDSGVEYFTCEVTFALADPYEGKTITEFYNNRESEWKNKKGDAEKAHIGYSQLKSLSLLLNGGEEPCNTFEEAYDLIDAMCQASQPVFLKVTEKTFGDGNSRSSAAVTALGDN